MKPIAFRESVNFTDTNRKKNQYNYIKIMYIGNIFK